MKLNLQKISKAIAGAVSAALASLASVAVDGDISLADVGIIAGAAVVGFVGVYWAPKNKPDAA